MSRRTQLTTKFTFALLAQLSENFIFIYLGLSLFTETTLEYKPLFILVTVIGICVARWCAVFPLASAINWFLRYRARRKGQEVAEEIPQNWKIMIFWAGLRGAVGVALAAGLSGNSAYVLKATVLVVVVLTVIIFGGTTSRMLEILNIRTGVVEEIDSDDEFDIEPVPHSGGVYAQRRSSAFGHTPKNSTANGGISLDNVNNSHMGNGSYSTAHRHTSRGSPPDDIGRRQSSRGREVSAAEQGLLNPDDFENDSDDEDLDLPPVARRSPQRPSSNAGLESDPNNPYPVAGTRDGGRGVSPGGTQLTARGAISSILNATSEDAGTLFSKLDENFLKPHLLLDPGGSARYGSGQSSHASGSGS